MADTDTVKWFLYATNLTTRLSELPVGRSHLYSELNEPGSGELTIPLDSTAASLVTSGMLCVCSYRGQTRGSFFIDNIAEDKAAAGEGGDRWLSVSGRGGMALLNDAIVWNDGNKKSTRQFQDVTKASILVTLITEAQARGGLAALTIDFDAVNDSSAVAWTDDETFNVNVGTTLLEVVQQMATYGIDFFMDYTGTGFVLSAYKNGYGSDITTTQFFRVGTNCEEVRSDQRSEEIANALHVNYQKGYIDVSDSTSITANRRRESLVSMKEAQTKKSATTYGAAKLALVKDPKLGVSVRVYDGIAPFVFLDYDLGDTVSLDVFGTVYEYRILGMQLDFDGEAYAHVTMELNDLLYDKQQRLARQLDWLENQWNTANDADLIEVSFWQNIGTPDNAITQVDAMHVYGGYLYIGGQTANPLISTFARKKLDTGIWEILFSSYSVRSITNVGTNIYFGTNMQGASWDAGNTCLKKYDTTTGVITDVPALNKNAGGGLDGSVCYALDAIGTNLYATGIFTNANGTAVSDIVKWDTVGATYSAMGAGLDSTGYALAHIGTDLYIGGAFTGKLTMWDGASYTIIAGPDADVYALANNDGTLIIGGAFTNKLASWDGVTYAAYAGGVNGNVRALAVYLTDVYAVGEFTDVGLYIALYSGSEWWKLYDGATEGLDDYGYCIALNTDDVYVGGLFLHAGGKSMSRMGAYYTSFQSMVSGIAATQFDLARAIHEATAETPSNSDEFVFWEDVSRAIRKITWANIKAFFVLASQTAQRILYSNDAGTVTTKDTLKFYEDDNQISLGDPYFANSAVPGIAEQADGVSVSNFMETYGTGFSSFISFIRGRGTKASPTAIQADDPIGRIRGRAWDGAGTLGATSADLFLVANQNHTPTAHGSRIDMYTTPDDSVTMAKALSIKANGDIDAQATNHFTVGGQEYVKEVIDNAAAATPADADKLGFWQSAGDVLKSITWANFKTTLDGLYLKLTGGTLTGALTITPSVDGTDIFQIFKSGGISSVFRVDTTNKRIFISNSTPIRSFTASGSELNIILVDTSNNLNFGSSTLITDLFFSGAGSARFFIGASERLRVDSVALYPMTTLTLGSATRIWNTFYGRNIILTGNTDVNQLMVTGNTTQTNSVAYLIDNTAATNTIRNVLQLETQSTGTAAAGLGARLLLSLETATNGTMKNAGALESSWLTPTNGAEVSKTDIAAYYNSTQQIGVSIRAQTTGTPEVNILGSTILTTLNAVAINDEPVFVNDDMVFL